MNASKMYLAAEKGNLDIIENIQKPKYRDVDSKGNNIYLETIKIAATNKNYNVIEYLLPYIDNDNLLSLAQDTAFSMIPRYHAYLINKHLLLDYPDVFKPLFFEIYPGGDNEKLEELIRESEINMTVFYNIEIDEAALIIKHHSEKAINFILENDILALFDLVKDYPNIYITDGLLKQHIKEKLSESSYKKSTILQKLAEYPKLFKGEDWENIMNLAVQSNNLELIKIILGNANSKDYNYGLNLLPIYPDVFNRLELIQYLFKKGANPNLFLKTNLESNSLSPTYSALLSANYPALMYLINEGGNLNISTKTQPPCLQYVFERMENGKDMPLVLNILVTGLEKGADPFLNTYSGDDPDGTPLFHYCIDRIIRSLKFDKTLLNTIVLTVSLYTKDFNVLDNWGRNLLHYVASNVIGEKYTKEDYTSILMELYELLVSLGVDPNHRAKIDNQQKVIVAKMKHLLPSNYGKTPEEILASKT